VALIVPLPTARDSSTMPQLARPCYLPASSASRRAFAKESR
jgi:hypothetical protein